MATYLESGLRLDLPDGQHFRFADLPAYQALSSYRLKEMDFAWLDGGKLFLLEVRSYAQVTETLTGAHFVPAKGQPAPFRYEALIDKVTDSLLMLLAAWAGSASGQALREGLPEGAKSRLPLKLVIAVDLPAKLAIHLQGLRDSLNARLRGRMALADVRNVVLIDYARLVADPRFSAFIRLQA
ncbi:hypothetical protein BH10PSE16_BH10PSE16_04500 [soil metagenome]